MIEVTVHGFLVDAATAVLAMLVIVAGILFTFAGASIAVEIVRALRPVRR